MKEVKGIGYRKVKGVNYYYSVFECPVCGSHTEKIKKDGIRAKSCSHKCYAKTRGRRGAYKGGTVVISGYIYEYAPDHPRTTNHGYVAQHRLVAEKNIGRYLNADEVAHHINEIKTDNRPENIQVMKAAEHIKYHKQKAKRLKNGQFTV